VSDAWEVLYLAASLALGGPIPDTRLLFLCLPIHPNENAVTLAVLAHIDLPWTSRETDGPLAPTVFKARVKYLASPASHPFSKCSNIVLYQLKKSHLILNAA
jgi:hypothetical protein